MREGVGKCWEGVGKCGGGVRKYVGVWGEIRGSVEKC